MKLFNLCRIEYSIWTTILIGLILYSCTDTIVTQVNEPEELNASIQETDPALTVLDGTLFIDNNIKWPLKNIESDPFIEMFLWVKGSGLFLINLNAVFPTSEAGEIIDNELHFTCGGFNISIIDNAGPLLSDGSTRGVAATLFPDYEIFSKSNSIDTENINVVIGFIKENRDEIPRWKENNFEFEPCPHPDS